MQHTSSKPADAGRRRRRNPRRRRPAGPGRGSATPVTRAALDPALVAGRGADVDFVEQEAENAATNGTVIGPDRTAYTLPAEASGRTAVQLDARASTSSSRCRARPTRSPCATASRTRRAAAASPRRSTSRSTAAPAQTHDADVAVRVALQPVPVHQRPERRPAAPRLVDHRVRAACRAATTPPPTITKPFRPDALLRRAAPAARPDATRPATRSGSPRRPAATPRGRSSTCSTPSSSAPPHVRPASRRTCCAFGADPTGRRDSADAFDKAIAFAQAARTSRSTSRRARTR